VTVEEHLVRENNAHPPKKYSTDKRRKVAAQEERNQSRRLSVLEIKKKVARQTKGRTNSSSPLSQAVTLWGPNPPGDRAFVLPRRVRRLTLWKHRKVRGSHLTGYETVPQGLWPLVDVKKSSMKGFVIGETISATRVAESIGKGGTIPPRDNPHRLRNYCRKDNLLLGEWKGGIVKSSKELECDAGEQFSAESSNRISGEFDFTLLVSEIAQTGRGLPRTGCGRLRNHCCPDGVR